MAVPIPKLTAQEYLAIERKADYKSEYYGGEMFAMPGGTSNHSRLSVHCAILFSAALKGRGCIVYNTDMRVSTDPSGLYTYPDLTVVCGKPIFADDQSDVLTNPKLILEVLSPSTEAKDRGFKFRQYKAIPSVEEYVLVSQSEPLIESCGRQRNGEWQIYPDAYGRDSIFTSRSLNIAIPLAEIYDGIYFQS